MMRFAAVAALLAAVLFLSGTRASADFHDYHQLDADAKRAIVDSPTRTIIDLSGTWECSVDGTQRQPVANPSTQRLIGDITYRRQVRIDASMLRRHTWHLQFLGVLDEVELRINGRSVDKYPGGLMPFSVRLPDRALTAGINTIELRFTPPGNVTHAIERMVRAGQQQSLGMIREAFLVGTPHAWASEIVVRPTMQQGRGQLMLRCSISGGDISALASEVGSPVTADRLSAQVEAFIYDRNNVLVARSSLGTVAVERSRTTTADVVAYVDQPQLWSPRSPALYRSVVRVTVAGRVVDEITKYVGFRTIAVGNGQRERQVLLNDSAIFINAVEYVDDHPRLSRTMTAQQMRQDVMLLKTLGVNAIRVRYGAPHPYFLQLCDEYGILAFVEIPAAEIPKSLLLHEETVARMRNLAQRMVAACDHHASVIGYGISSGLQESIAETNSLHAQLVPLVKQGGSKLTYKTVPTSAIDDVSEGGFDVMFVRADTRESSNAMAARIDLARSRIRSAAIIASFGSVVSPANLNGFSDPLSGQAQALLIRDQYRASKAAGVAGVCVWTFNDYHLERPTMLVDHYDAYMRTSGIVDEWRQPRVAYTMLKSLINDEKEPLLQARDMATDTPLVFIVTGIMLGLLIVALSNRSRRFREYALRSILRPYNFYADIRDQRILSTVQTTFLGIIISTSAGLVLATVLYVMRTSPTFEYLMHIVFASDGMYEAIRAIAWRPGVAIIACSSVVFLMLVTVAALCRVGAMFVKSRIFFRDTLTIVVWSALPLVVLLPIGIALYQVLSTETMSLWIPILLLSVSGWFVMRCLRATSVVFDVRPLFVYAIGIGAVLSTVVVVVSLYDSWYDALAFLQYFVAVVAS
ncbi:MAG: hypothetical protein FGM24_05850 [Candidatus Kapabacteria bacterium]|nr:hypothetical protein [Candidatus Kapabacteria bacterium]